MNNSTYYTRDRKGMLGMFMALLMAVVIALSVIGAPSAAWAADNDPAAAQTELQGYVKQKIAGNSYGIEGGGTVMGNDLLVMNSTTNQFEVDGVRFSQLDSKSQQRFVNDLATYARSAADPANVEKASQTPSVTNATVTNWFRDLQDTPGVGTRLLSEMMGDIAPDFVGAHQVLSPFQSGFNLFLGIIGVLIMAGLTMTILLDVVYMTVPAARHVLGDGESGGGGGDDAKGRIKKLFSVSTDARNAMKKADGEGGSTSSALVNYLWKRSLGLLVLGILLVLLVQGKLFNLVGIFMDLVAGLPVLN